MVAKRKGSPETGGRNQKRRLSISRASGTSSPPLEEKKGKDETERDADGDVKMGSASNVPLEPLACGVCTKKLDTKRQDASECYIACQWPSCRSGVAHRSCLKPYEISNNVWYCGTCKKNYGANAKCQLTNDEIKERLFKLESTFLRWFRQSKSFCNDSMASEVTELINRPRRMRFRKDLVKTIVLPSDYPVPQLRGAKGVASLVRIQKHTVVAVYEGRMCIDNHSMKSVLLSEKNHKVVEFAESDGTEIYVLDGAHDGNGIAENINDFRMDVKLSDKSQQNKERAANCGFVQFWIRRGGTDMPEIAVITTVDVNAGTELLLDYGKNYWKDMHDIQAASAAAVAAASSSDLVPCALPNGIPLKIKYPTNIICKECKNKLEQCICFCSVCLCATKWYKMTFRLPNNKKVCHWTPQCAIKANPLAKELLSRAFPLH
jgi:hypothetical protein